MDTIKDNLLHTMSSEVLDVQPWDIPRELPVDVSVLQTRGAQP